MASLVIKKIKYLGRNYRYESPELEEGLNVITGPNGTGKTTFSSLLYFGLGGNPYQFRPDSREKQEEIVGDTDNFVDIEFEIDNIRYLARRFFEKNYVLAGKVGKEGESYPVYRNRKEDFIFSDWILEKLGLEVATINLGNSEWQLNINDYLRLMYQNQALQERTVFKSPDVVSFITDSSQNRKAIFELLLGKMNSELYRLRGEYKAELSKKMDYKVRLGSFEDALETIFKANSERKNIVFLEKELEEEEGRLDKLLSYKKKLQKAPIRDVQLTSDIGILRDKLIRTQQEEEKIHSKLENLVFEENRYRTAIFDLQAEVEQINKVIFSHKRLNLFFPETCPYCLERVEREKGHCICGKPVKESEYEKFFYDPDEYIEIIKGKKKNIKTLEDAVHENLKEQGVLRKEELSVDEKKDDIMKSLEELADSKDFSYFDTSKLDEIDDEIIELKTKINELEKAISLEFERNQLSKLFNTASDKCEELKAKLKELEGASELEILNIRKAFNHIYQDFLMGTIKDVTSARIDDEYEPTINEGTYREMSIVVGKRLFYYLTLYKMSAMDTSIPFPRFLLIDTPKTAGLDSETYKRFLLKVKETVEDNESIVTGQVILTTGNEDFPEDLLDDRVEVLTDSNRLLKRNEKDSSD